MHILTLHGTILVACLICLTGADDQETCEANTWGGLLERWVVGSGQTSDRQGRILAVPAARGYYIADRVDGPRYDEWPGLTPPPPPHPGKIVNRPTKPMMKSGYIQQKPTMSHQRPPATMHGKPGAADRLDGTGNSEPARREVSETDLYLLAAIEKLVYRADLAEKRLRRLEDSLHYLLAGKEAAPEPCSANYTRVGNTCYSFSAEALDWQGASAACRRHRAALLELVEPGARRQLTTAIMADPGLRGSDWWTSGLNPGLLWIWSGSARAVLANGTDSAAIPGEGRCLALVFDPAARVYSYRGQDCALRQRYVCQLKENQTLVSNEIERVARKLRDRYEARNGRVLLNDIHTS